MLVQARVDGVAGAEARNPFAHRLHLAGEIVAEDERKRIADKRLDAALADLEVEGVNAGGAHLGQEVAGPGRRFGQIDDGDRLFIAADGGGFHGVDSLARKPPKLAANRAVEASTITSVHAAWTTRFSGQTRQRGERGVSTRAALTSVWPLRPQSPGKVVPPPRERSMTSC